MKKRKYPASPAPAAASCSGQPPALGPATLGELFGWPAVMIDEVMARGGMQGLIDNVNHLCMGTFYSGMLTPEVGCHAVVRELSQRGLAARLSSCWSCDNGKGPHLRSTIRL